MKAVGISISKDSGKKVVQIKKEEGENELTILKQKNEEMVAELDKLRSQGSISLKLESMAKPQNHLNNITMELSDHYETMPRSFQEIIPKTHPLLIKLIMIHEESLKGKKYVINTSESFL